LLIAVTKITEIKQEGLSSKSASELTLSPKLIFNNNNGFTQYLVTE